MRKLQIRIFAMFLAVIMLFTVVPMEVTAVGETTVTVSVEKFVLGQGYVVEPVLVTVPTGSNLAQAVDMAFTNQGIHTQYWGTVQSGYYLSSVQDPNRGAIQVPQEISADLASNGISVVDDATPDTLDGGDYEVPSSGGWAMSGWMISVNSQFPSSSISDITANEGDVVRVQYSLTGGSDVDASVSGWSTPIYPNLANKTEITKAVAEANKEQLTNTYYLSQNQLQIAYDTAMTVLKDIKSTQTQVNVAYQALTGKESQISGSNQQQPVVTSGIKTNQEAMVQSSTDTAKYIKDKGTLQFGAEWLLLGMARDEVEVPAGYYESYLQSVEDTLKSGAQSLRVTDDARLVLALSALKQDVTNMAGVNLLEAFADYDAVCRTGIYGPMFVLLALDSNNYKIPQNQIGGTQTTRENLVQYILNQELDTVTGGWGWNGVADVDTTAMAIQALTPYYQSNSQVQGAIDRGLNTLSGIQCADGTYASFGTPNAESTAQVIVALTGLNINPATDARFIKNGFQTMDGLMKFAIAGGGFSHELKAGINGYATEQAFYALTAYQRMIEGKTPLYQMSDAKGISAKQPISENIDTVAASTVKNTAPNTVFITDKQIDGNTGENVKILKQETIKEADFIEEAQDKKENKKEEREVITEDKIEENNWKKVIPIVAGVIGVSGVGILAATRKKVK